MYHQIIQLKELGFSKSRSAKQLGINRETVTRYWDMTTDEFDAHLYAVRRTKAIWEYQSIIIGWIKQFPTVTAAQIQDWLQEQYHQEFKKRTVSRYVKELREQYHLLKSNRPRDYEAVEELPMGQQIQVDFGEMALRNIDGGKTKVYVAGFVLSHSRYKWGVLQTRPFTTTDLVNACHGCFSYMGGTPHELVFDQDSIVCVKENAGDIIYTFEFEKFRQEYDFKIYLCRKADPESKGKIENVVKYIKYNFLENRLFVDDGILNGSFLDWLNRTGNAKVHGTTKRVPAEVFQEERDMLRALPATPLYEHTSICRTVRKDNTIVYDSNRYSVPLGTYNKQKEVRIAVQDGKLVISDEFGDMVICEHTISPGRGLLIKSTNHSRDRESSVEAWQQKLNGLLDMKATTFLQEIRIQKSRYSRDQFQLLQQLLEQFGKAAVLEAIAFCEENRLYSANYTKDFLANQVQPVADQPAVALPVSNKKYHVTTQKRSLDEYAKAGGM